MNTKISALLQESIETKKQALRDESFLLSASKAFEIISATVQGGGTVYSCGNGGSACDAMHFTEELVARYKRERPGIRAMHFQDSSTISCWANDYSFESVFARQVETFCTPRDCLVAISTSGNSGNIVKACEAAKTTSTPVIGLSGKKGGQLAELADVCIVVPSEATERIQEVHITLVHIWCELLET